MEEIRKALKNFADNASEEEIKALVNGINQISCEYGWDGILDNNNLIKLIWKN